MVDFIKMTWTGEKKSKQEVISRRGTTGGREGGVLCPFFKIRKKYPDFAKKKCRVCAFMG